MEKYLNNKKVFYLDIIFDTISRTMPHAILTILFLHKGVTIPQIALIQAVYNLAVIIFEFPSGVLSDLYSRKTVYIISNSVMIISYFILIFCRGFIFISIVWFLYGISTALSSGTLESEIIVYLKYKGIGIERFLKNSNQTSLITSIISVSIGSILYYNIGVKMYFISVILLSINLFITYKYFKCYDSKIEKFKKTCIISHIKESIIELKNTPLLKSYIIIFGIIQIFIQTHFQLWQVLFLNRGINKKLFFIFYIIFQLVGIFSYNVKVNKLKIKHLIYILFTSFVLTLILQTGINNIIFIAIYSIICFSIFVINYFCTVEFNKIVSKEKISSLTSLSSTITRLFSFLILLACSYLLNMFNIKIVYLINYIITFILCAILLIKIKNTTTKKYT